MIFKLKNIFIGILFSVSALGAVDPWTFSKTLSSGNVRSIVISDYFGTGPEGKDAWGQVQVAHLDDVTGSVNVWGTKSILANDWFYIGTPGKSKNRIAATAFLSTSIDVSALTASDIFPENLFIACISVPCINQSWSVYGTMQKPELSNTAFKTVDLFYQFPNNKSYFAFTDINNGGRLSVAVSEFGGPWKILGAPGFSPTGASEVSITGPREISPAVYVAYLDGSSNIRVYKLLDIFGIIFWKQVGPALGPQKDVTTYHMDLAIHPESGQPYVVYSTDQGPRVARLDTTFTNWEFVGGSNGLLPLGAWDCRSIDFNSITNEPLVGCLKQENNGSGNDFFPMVAKFTAHFQWVSLGDIKVEAATPSLFSDMDMTYSRFDDSVWLAFRSFGDSKTTGTGQLVVANKKKLSF